MLLVLLFVVIVIVGLILFNKTHNLIELGGVMWILGGIVLAGMLLAIGLNHLGTNAEIEKNKMYCESIEKKIDAINNEYEDVSTVNVIGEINDWNSELYLQRYWYKNPWVSWFYNAKVIEAKEYIDMDSLVIKA